jgi:hypothetical protein
MNLDVEQLSLVVHMLTLRVQKLEQMSFGPVAPVIGPGSPPRIPSEEDWRVWCQTNRLNPGGRPW